MGYRDLVCIGCLGADLSEASLREEGNGLTLIGVSRLLVDALSSPSKCCHPLKCSLALEEDHTFFLFLISHFIIVEIISPSAKPRLNHLRRVKSFLFHYNFLRAERVLRSAVIGHNPASTVINLIDLLASFDPSSTSHPTNEHFTGE